MTWNLPKDWLIVLDMPLFENAFVGLAIWFVPPPVPIKTSIGWVGPPGSGPGRHSLPKRSPVGQGRRGTSDRHQKRRTQKNLNAPTTAIGVKMLRCKPNKRIKKCHCNMIPRQNKHGGEVRILRTIWLDGRERFKKSKCYQNLSLLNCNAQKYTKGISEIVNNHWEYHYLTIT